MSEASPKGAGQDARSTNLPGANLHERSEPQGRRAGCPEYKFAGSKFERTKCGPEGVEGRMPGVIPRSPPLNIYNILEIRRI